MRTCLQNVLDLNPANQQAQQGLARIESRYGLAAPPDQPSPPLPPPAPPAEPEIAPHEPQPSPAPAPIDDRHSSTAPTARADPRASSAGAALPAPTATRPAAPAEPIVAAPPEHPCPYCGAPTVLKQQACTQCRGDLMLRAAPPDKRSLALTLLGVLWGIGGVLVLGLTALMFLLFLRVRQDAPAIPGARPADRLLLAVAIMLVIGLLYIGLARGLLARRRWAFYVNMGLIVLSLFGTLSSLAAGALLAGLLSASLERADGAGSLAGTLSLIAAVVLGIGFVLLPIVLTVLSARDFFGPKVRFQPTVESADHLVHYNNGIAYKNRGMWYMAAQEWEAAVSKKPREPNYLHALGLAYAQLKQPDRARATLDRALQSAPDNLQIKESRALIDQIATKK
jgi:hypothetical protein